MPAFLSAMSPLSLIVLLVFLFGVALVVALWSLLTLGSSPRGIATPRAARIQRPEKVRTVQPKPAKSKANELKPLPSNRFMKQRLEADLGDNVTSSSKDDLVSELPTDHVSRSRVRILKTLAPDPELETPAFKPTTYDQMVNRQRVPKTTLPKMNLPRTGLPADALRSPPPTHLNTTPSPEPPKQHTQPQQSSVPELGSEAALQPPLTLPRRVTAPPRVSTTEDTSTQPSLFEAGRKRAALEPEPPRPPQPSVQREASEAAFKNSQPATPKSQQEKDEAFENFLRKNDDLGF
jgi:hypothetical protein